MKDEIRDKSVAQYKYLKFCLRQIRLTMDNHREMCDIKLLADVCLLYTSPSPRD